MLSLPPTRVDAAFPQRRQTHTHLSSSAADIKKGFPPEYMLRKNAFSACNMHTENAFIFHKMSILCLLLSGKSFTVARHTPGCRYRFTRNYKLCRLRKGPSRQFPLRPAHICASVCSPLVYHRKSAYPPGAYIPSQMKDFPCFEKFRPTMRLISSQHCTVESVQGKTVILPLPKMLS